MAIIQHIRDRLMPRQDHLAQPSGFLRPIDTDKLARSLNIEQEACDNALQELPPSDASLPDAIEHKTIQLIQSNWAAQRGELINHLQGYATRLAGLSVDAVSAQLKINGSDTLKALRAASHRAAAELGPLQEYFLEAQRELVAFRQKHRLARPAHLVSTRWTTVGLLLLLLAMETIINGFFFATGSEYGLLGGIGVAVGIATTNVVISFLLGLGPARWIIHRHFIVKLLGVFVLLSFSLGLIILHVLAVHMRELARTLETEPELSAAIRHILEHPLSVTDLNSLYLFGLGLICSFAAAWKGYRFDDPYPGYGRRWRGVEAARTRYASLHSDLFDDLEHIKDQTLEALDTGLTHIPLIPQTAANIRKQRAGLLQKFETYEESVEISVNHLLSLYRTTNRQKRTTSPPSYFEEKWKLPQRLRADPEILQLRTEAHEAPINISSSLNELRELAEEILQEYESLLSAYPHTTQMS